MHESKDQKQHNASTDPPVSDYVAAIKAASEETQPQITERSSKWFSGEVGQFASGLLKIGWFPFIKKTLSVVFAFVLFVFVVVWTIFAGYFLYQAAFHKETFYLSDAVLIAMITSTTATVFGLFHYANRWLFDLTQGGK